MGFFRVCAYVAIRVTFSIWKLRFAQPRDSLISVPLIVAFYGCFLVLRKALLGSYCVVVWGIVSCLLFFSFYVTW